MYIFFGILLFITFLIILPIGIVKPAWLRVNSRKKVLKYVGGAVVALLLLTIVTAPSTPKSDQSAVFVPVQHSGTTTPAIPSSLEQKIKSYAPTVYGNEIGRAHV